MYGTHVADRLVKGQGGVRRWPSRILLSKRRRWESNPLQTALQAVAVPSGSSAQSSSVLARSRTWSSTFAGSRAIRNTPRTCFISAPRRGIEPRPAVSMTAMRSGTPAGRSFKCLDQGSNLDLDLRRALCDPLRHRDVFNKHPDLESNQVQGFRKALCVPLHHRDKPEPTTGFAPASCGLLDRRLSQSSHVGNSSRSARI